MRLYHSPTSPFVRKVMLALHETGQTGDVTLVPASGSPLDPGTSPLAANPLGKVPVLERPDGPALFDSRVICRFLDDRAGGGLYPAPPRLWDTLTLEALADGICEAALLIVYEGRLREEGARSPAWVEGQWSKVARSLDTLEARWLAYLAGRRDMGHLALAAALGYLDFRHGERGWRRGRHGLAAWFEAQSGTAAMAATAPQT